MSKIAINKEAVINISKQMGFVKEHENTDRNFMRFRYKDAPQYDARFAIVVYTVVDMTDGIIAILSCYSLWLQNGAKHEQEHRSLCFQGSRSR